MEKNARKIKPSTIIMCIVSLIYIAGIITVSYFTIDFHNKTLEEKKIIKDKKNELHETKEIYVAKENEKLELDKQIEELENVKENIENTKKEVFSLASELEKKIKSGQSKYKIAYLTFDDGPYYLTHSYLSVLDKYGVKATFFTIGQDKDRCFDNRSQDCSIMYKKIVDSGHTIANHTYSHSIFGSLYTSTYNFMTQINKQHDLIKTRTGVDANIMRFPGGSATARGLKNSIIAELRKKNYGWVDWTAQNGDGGSVASKQQAWNNFVGTINDPIEVVLFHDYNNITLSMLPEAIEYLQKNNYILLPLFYDSVMINK